MNTNGVGVMAVVTISREFGAGGRTLGEMISKRLQYEFLDDAVIQELATRLGVTKDSIANMEKKNAGFFASILSKMFHRNYMERLATGTSDYVDEDIYLDKLEEVIEDLAARDNVVLLGRGSQFVLAGHPEAIHFLLVADRTHRIHFLQRNYNLSESQARQEVLAGEHRRKHVYAKMGCTAYDDPLNYHMVLNTSRLSLEVVAQQMVMLIERKQHEPIIPLSLGVNIRLDLATY
jgi:cytidylate kinase